MQDEEYELSKELTPLPINYSYKKLKNSYFKPSAEEEHFQNRVDNMNMLYVLFTRAKQSLRIYGREMKSDRRSQLINDTIFGSDYMTELLKGSTIEEFEDGDVHYKKFEYGESVPTRKFVKNKEQKNPFVSELQNLLFTMKTYPFEGKYVVIGGNMRLRACKDLGYMEVPCKVLDESTPVLKLREYSIKDNEAFGQNDWDILANEWDMEELQDWGMELMGDWNAGGEGKYKNTVDSADNIEQEYKIEVDCKNESAQDELINKLTEEGYKCRILTL